MRVLTTDGPGILANISQTFTDAGVNIAQANCKVTDTDRAVNTFEAVHVLLFPMLMMCLHKHSLGACAGMREMLEPSSFIRTHVDVVVRGLKKRPEEESARPAGARS